MTDEDRKLLDFEEAHPRNDRRKEAAIRTELSMSWVRYRQVLARLIVRPEVLEHYASVAHRVERATTAGVARRAARQV